MPDVYLTEEGYKKVGSEVIYNAEIKELPRGLLKVKYYGMIYYLDLKKDILSIK